MIINDVNICVEAVGSQDDPPILLIAGIGASMDLWPPDLCRRLAQGGRYVIRYDHRDTGQSVSYPPGQPGYTGATLTRDAVAVIDEVAGGRAHLVGMSAGGGIAQEIAALHPERVATLTLVATSPAYGRDGLPPPAERFEQAFADQPPEPDWTDTEAVVDYLVEIERPWEGVAAYDEAAARAVMRRMVERTVNIESAAKNHEVMEQDEAGPPRQLSDISARTLVVHGTDDPAFPIGHAHALVEGITGAELLVFDGMGHQVPPRSTWDTFVEAVLRHTAEPTA